MIYTNVKLKLSCMVATYVHMCIIRNIKLCNILAEKYVSSSKPDTLIHAAAYILYVRMYIRIICTYIHMYDTTQ